MNMKKIIVGIFLTLILFYGISVCAESNDIKIRLDGQILNTENWEVKPFVQDGKVMAPVRSFAETAGFSVGWSEYKVVTVERDEYKIWFTIGINVIHIGTKGNYNIDTVPYILNDKTILPIRCLAEALNMSVKWNSENNEVEIISTMPGTDDPSSEDWDRKVLNMQWCNSYI